jgi:hypothetical protein
MMPNRTICAAGIRHGSRRRRIRRAAISAKISNAMR